MHGHGVEWIRMESILWSRIESHGFLWSLFEWIRMRIACSRIAWNSGGMMIPLEFMQFKLRFDSVMRASGCVIAGWLPMLGHHPFRSTMKAIWIRFRRPNDFCREESTQRVRWISHWKSLLKESTEWAHRKNPPKEPTERTHRISQIRR